MIFIGDPRCGGDLRRADISLGTACRRRGAVGSEVRVEIMRSRDLPKKGGEEHQA